MPAFGVRPATIQGVVLVLLSLSCGPSHPVVRRIGSDGSAVEPNTGGAGDMGGTGGVGGATGTGGASGSGGTNSAGGTGGAGGSSGAGGTAPRDASADLALSKPDAMDEAAPDTGPDRPPDAATGLGKTVLLVMGSATPRDPVSAIRASDARLRSRLEGRSFKVVLGDDDDPDSSKAMDANLVIITDTTTTSKIGAKYTQLQVPVLCTSGALYDHLKMTTNSGSTSTVSQLAIIDPTSALAAGATGTISVSSNAIQATYGAPVGAVQKVATIAGQPNQIAIFAYPKEAMMNGIRAPARRIGFFATENMVLGMNDTGWRLFDAAVDWATQ